MAKIKSRMNLNSNKGFDLMAMCTPATIYFVISLIALIILGVSNLGNNDRLCIGNYDCNVGNNTIVFTLNAIYILFWTFLLDLMCKNGYTAISWFVLLLPFLLSFIFLAMIMMKTK
jgi:hypothetical protein